MFLIFHSFQFSKMQYKNFEASELNFVCWLCPPICQNKTFLLFIPTFRAKCILHFAQSGYIITNTILKMRLWNSSCMSFHVASDISSICPCAGCWFVALLTVNIYVMLWRSVHLTTLFYCASLNNLLTSTSFAYFACN